MSVIDPIAIATQGYVCDTRVEPIAIATHGYVCVALPVDEEEIGGDPDGAWERARRRFKRIVADRRAKEVLERSDVDGIKVRADEETAQVDAIVDELLEEQQALEITLLERAIELEAEIADLEARRMELRLEEIRLELAAAEEFRTQIAEELMLLLAIAALFFDTQETVTITQTP